MELADIPWSELLPFIVIGFLAQLIDGALGMAFGAIATALLVGLLGVSPAHASMKVHAIKSITGGISGISHAIAGNINKRLFFSLVFPGMIGGVIGAYGLAQVDGNAIKPFVFGYLCLLGLILIYKGIKGKLRSRAPRAIAPLGVIGGFLDAIGGGGWGPVVGSALLLQGSKPRKVVGSVNSAECFVAFAISGAFIGQFGIEQLAGPTLGLMIGGVIAAPLGAVVARYLSGPALLVLVGGVLSAITGYWLLDNLLP
jgi:uncharacterized membrane protein YfcA